MSSVLSGLSSALSSSSTISPLSSSLLSWTLSNANGSISHIPASFPSQSHLDLIANGIIDDPNIGLNEGTTRWVGADDWAYQVNLLPLVKDAGEHENWVLVFEGLDTVCDVQLANKTLGKTNNQFRRWEFDVTTPVKNHANGTHLNLTLSFESASKYADAQAASGGEGFPPPSTVVYEYPNRQWVRKQQSDWGWDWGPAYLPMGPHKPAYLIGLGSSSSSSSSSDSAEHKRGHTVWDQRRAAIENDPSSWFPRGAEEQQESDDDETDTGSDVGLFVSTTSVDIYRKGQINNLWPSQTADWVVNVTLSVWVSGSDLVYNKPKLLASVAGQSSGAVKLSGPLKSGYNEGLWASFTIPGSGSDAPELWWPSTMGNPKLYSMSLTLKTLKDTSGAAGTSASWTESTGFRTIVVDQSNYTAAEVATGIQPGSKFQFVLNGEPFYVQGSSIIPFDTFYPRVNTSTLEWHIRSALAAGQNVLRVWGGASYQSDDFYDLCDQLGILAWSETIAACSMYPTHPDFVANWVQELGENVRRINRHPSIALWAGNNEGEGYMLWTASTLSNGSAYEKQYNELFDGYIRGAVLDNTRAISYIPSSTTQGYLQLYPYIPRYDASSPGANYGDKELYNYDTSASFDLDNYPYARFVNEFGFHSMASIYTFERVLTASSQYTFNGTVVANHDKHSPPGSTEYPYFPTDGQAEMTEGVIDWYPEPKVSDAKTLFAQWAYSTQVFQAAFMASEIGYYRLLASRSANNRGAIYWQLNQIWEASDWASIEYGGRWKVFHYVAARVQDHVIANPIYYTSNQTLELYATSDLFESVSGTATWTWYNFAGQALANATTKSFTVGAISSTLLYRSPSNDLAGMIPGNGATDDAWLHFQLSATDSGGTKHVSEQFFQPVPVKESPLKDPKITITSNGDQTFEVTAKGSGVAAWVNVEHPVGVVGYFSEEAVGGRPSNAFYLRPGEVRTLKFNVFTDTTGGSWTKGVTARSLYNNLAS